MTSGWIRPVKFRLPDSTAVSAVLSEPAGAGDSGPELPMQVPQPNPVTWKPSRSRCACRPLDSRSSAAARDPGVSEVLVHGAAARPAATALRASRPAVTRARGLDVLVQLVIAAMAMSPLYEPDSPRDAGTSDSDRASCGRDGPASVVSTAG